MSQIYRQMLQKALATHQQGKLQDAIRQYNAVLAMDAQNFDALQLKGLAVYQAGDAKTAVELLSKAIKRNSGMASVFNNRGLAHQALGQRNEALADFNKALSLTANYAEAHCNRGNVLRELRRFAEAADAINRALKLNPQVPTFLNSLGVVRSDEKEWTAALQLFDAAIRLQPAYVDALVNRANALNELRRFEEALSSYDRAISLQPNHAEAFSNRANTLLEMRRLEEALASYDRAVSLKPDYAEAFNSRGNVLKQLNRLPEALASCERTISLWPNYPEGYVNCGSVLRTLFRFEEALVRFDQALALRPDYAEAQTGRSIALKELNRLDEALDSSSTAIRLKPDHADAYINRAQVLRKMLRLEEAGEDTAIYLRLSARGDAAAEAFAADWAELLSLDSIPGVYETEAEIHATRNKVDAMLDGLLDRHQQGHALSPSEGQIAARGIGNLTGFFLAYQQMNDRETMRKLSTAASRLMGVEQRDLPRRSRAEGPMRIGIASQRLRNHNGANWAYNWLARLPRQDYSFFTYNFDTLQDTLSAKFEALGTHRQMNFDASSQQEVLDRMHGDRLDVLMLPDVGMTPVSRFLSINRIAPCQFTAWGHPVTSGAAAMDFYLSSDLMEPADAQAHYTERLVRLPNLALYLEEPEERPPSGKSFGLPEGRVLFGCLQSLFKYVPRYDDVYPQIAREVPGALFVFIEGAAPYMTEIFRQRLAAVFAAHGLDAERHIMFMPRQSGRDFDELMRQMDVNADSLGWSGGNTSLTSIASAVPLVTMAGEFMRGRHTSAMFSMMGTEEFTATSPEEYVRKLIAMGRDRDQRLHAAERLRANAPKLYHDASFVAAFDRFLKDQCAAG
ncbi:tetratricopeptide repeat protein [Aestuariivirga sp.]|uniref:tetratricopeptide repeat protein n=1 Tax=Aestuariivirga sp. TaxID=2650926 RepID=UPI003BAD019F